MQPITTAPGQRVARDERGVVRVEKLEPSEFDPTECTLSLEAAGDLTWEGLRLTWDFGSYTSAQPYLEQFDADALGKEITLRHWRSGDRFQPIGMAQSSKLQDLFTNLKIPEPERHRRAVAATEQGDIFWIEGIRIGEIAKVTPQTRRVLRWTWHR
jgi:tRNA(Ile)-lysidine synthetase-like protein